MTREAEDWVTTSINERMLDFIHGQVTEFDPSNPFRPGWYFFGINADDPSHIICADMQSHPRRVRGLTCH